jgi:hypothetical protein
MPVIIGATEVVSEGLKMSGNNTRKAFNRFYTKNSCIRDMAHNKESATICNLKSRGGVHHWFMRRSTRGREPVVVVVRKHLHNSGRKSTGVRSCDQFTYESSVLTYELNSVLLLDFKFA